MTRLRGFSLGCVAALAACHVDTFGISDGQTSTSSIQSTDVASSSGSPTSTATGSTTGAVTTTSLGTTGGTSGPSESTGVIAGTSEGTVGSTGSTGASTGASSLSTTGSSTGPDCPVGTSFCEGDLLKTCDGDGGLTEEACEYGCVDGVGCQDCIATIKPQNCPDGLPRVMVLLDASSSMLNINGGTLHGAPGLGGWDQVRDALAGETSVLDLIFSGQKVESLSLFGLAVFGHNSPEEQKIVVQYGACHKANLAWALEPNSSCTAPGCVDAYADPPIKWTFKDGSLVGPLFGDKTISHMPKCDLSQQQPKACIGSGTYTHLGLNLIQSNVSAYKGICAQDQYGCTAQTEYVNILITDGKYNSTDAQVQMPLQAMYSAGVTTFVIGFGDAVDVNQLNKMADWGSGNLLDYYDANNQEQLEMSLKAIMSKVDFCL